MIDRRDEEIEHLKLALHVCTENNEAYEEEAEKHVYTQNALKEAVAEISDRDKQLTDANALIKSLEDICYGMLREIEMGDTYTEEDGSGYYEPMVTYETLESVRSKLVALSRTESEPKNIRRE